MILDHVSHSQLEMWQRCPKQWEYRYVHGLKVPPSGALIEGGCYHKALEGNFKQKVVSLEDLPLEQCLELYSDAWENRLSEEEYVDWGDKDPGYIKDEGIGLVGEYILSVSPAVQPAKVEEVYVSEVGGVKLVVIVDLEDTKKAIIDHKTSGKAYTQDDVDKSLQASAAAFVVGRPIVFYNHVAVKSRMPRIQLIRTYRTQADIDWWADMAVKIVVQMRSGVAPPRPGGWWCSPRFCGFYERCRGECMRSYF